MNRTAATGSCLTPMKALANARMTSRVVQIALPMARWSALFRSRARRFRRGMSDLRRARGPSSSAIVFKLRTRSMMPFIRAIRMETKLATEPSRKAGAMAWEMIWESWLTSVCMSGASTGQRGP